MKNNKYWIKRLNWITSKVNINDLSTINKRFSLTNHLYDNKLKIPVELSVPRNRSFTKTCSYADGDRCSSNETPLNLISRHQVPVVARAETRKENGAALDAVSRISRPGIAYGSWERVESLADFQSFSPFFPLLFPIAPSSFLLLLNFLNFHACSSFIRIPEIVYFRYDKRVCSMSTSTILRNSLVSKNSIDSLKYKNDFLIKFFELIYTFYYLIESVCNLLN